MDVGPMNINHLVNSISKLVLSNNLVDSLS